MHSLVQASAGTYMQIIRFRQRRDAQAGTVKPDCRIVANGVFVPNIVAAQFDDFETAKAALRSLHEEGFPSEHTNQFYRNAGGQHARFPIGGDQFADPEAKGAGKGALKGAAIGGAAGLAVGLAASPVAGPAAVVGGLAAGAYAGSLAGAVGSLGKGETHPDEPINRPAGVVVAVYAPTASERERANAIFQAHRAHSIEEADGTWKDGVWLDFNPVSIPEWRKAPVE